MRVCFLTQYFPPEVGAPQARLLALARGLGERGCDVTVHTGFPHYPSGRILAPYRPGLLRREDVDGVRVVRSAVLPLPNRGTASRLADHAAFAAGALAASGCVGEQDVVVAESPPLFLAAAAIGYAAGRRAALVVNVADRWPESVVAVGALRRGRLVSAAERLEALVYRRATAITTPTEGLAQALDAHPDARGRVHRLRPIVDLARVPSSPVRPREGPLRVLYAGAIGLAQRLDTLIEAAATAGPAEVEVKIAGAGADAARLRAVTRGVRNVTWLGVVPRAEVARLYEDTEVVVVLLRDEPLFHDALPTKLVEAMAAGRPVVLSAAGEAAGHVERADSGVVVAPEDPQALAGAFARLRDRRSEFGALGERGRRHVATELDPASVIDDWANLLESVACVSDAGRQPANRRRAERRRR